MKVDIIENRNVYHGFFRLQKVQLRYRRFDGSMSRKTFLECLERGDAVAVILYDPKADAVVLIRQFRIGTLLADHEPWCMEIVAGACDGDNNYPAVAKREIEEETGWKVDQLQFLFPFFIAPSSSSEQIYLFLGLIDSKARHTTGGGLIDEDEDIETHIVSFAEAWKMVEEGVINSATAILAMQWLAMNREKLREEAI
ncbi:NUDIX domain-containing protein [Magnetococcales bacterium HHB-1]